MRAFLLSETESRSNIQLLSRHKTEFSDTFLSGQRPVNASKALQNIERLEHRLRQVCFAVHPRHLQLCPIPSTGERVA